MKPLPLKKFTSKTNQIIDIYLFTVARSIKMENCFFLKIFSLYLFCDTLADVQCFAHQEDIYRKYFIYL